MRGLTQDFAHGNLPVMGDRVEAGLLGHAEARHPVRSVAIHPFYLVDFLAGRFDQIAQESRLVDFSFYFFIHIGVSERLLAVALLVFLTAAAGAWFVTANLRCFATDGDGREHDFFLGRRAG